MDSSSKNRNELIALFGKYISLQPDSEELYYPDKFIKEIHRAYLNDNKIALPHPLYATWDIIDVCNLSCAFCSASAPHSSPEKKSNPLSIDIANKIITSGIKYVSIRGGEPTLCLELPQIVKKLIENSIFVEIVTNGIYIYDNFFNSISEIGKDMIRIKISFDSYDQKTNDNQRGKNSYISAIKAMKCCAANDFKYRVQMVITQNNYMDILKTYELVSKLGASSFGIILLLPIGRGKESSLRVSINVPILQQLLNILENKNNKGTILEKLGLGVDAIDLYLPILSKYMTTQEEAIANGHLKCNGFKTRIYISSSGNVYPCDLLQYEKYYGGSFLSDNYWNSQAAKYMRSISRLQRNKCSSCSEYGCNMGCPAIGLCNENQDLESSVPNCEV